MNKDKIQFIALLLFFLNHNVPITMHLCAIALSTNEVQDRQHFPPNYSSIVDLIGINYSPHINKASSSTYSILLVSNFFQN